MFVNESNTLLLMHMNSLPLKDECGSTIANNAVILNSSIKKFGNNSGYFNGSNSYLLNNTSFNFGLGDFTIAFNFNAGSQSVSYPIAIADQPSNWYGLYISDAYNSGKLSFCVPGASFTRILVSNSTLLDSIWHHVAVTRKNGVSRLFIDGKLNATYNTNYTFNIPKIYIGYDGGQSVTYFKGYLDEFIITNTALWYSDFTPPISEYAFSKFLIQDGTALDNTDGTGLTNYGTTPYTISVFDSYGMNNLNNINSAVISKIINQKYNIPMLK